MVPPRFLCSAVALALAASLFAASTTARAVEPEEVLAYLGFDASAVGRLEAGEILSQRIQEGKERTELAISVVALFEESLDEAYESVVRGETFQVDRNIVDHRELKAWPPDPAEFAGVEFSASEADEVAKLLRFGGG